MDNIRQLQEKLRAHLPQLELRADELLARHTSFRIGGPIRLMALPKSEQEAIVVLQTAQACGLDPIFLGKGSNLLIADEGIDGFAIKLQASDASIVRLSKDSLQVDAACSLAQVAVYAMEESLSGMEFAHGIPGSIGGAVVMNAGAYEGEMSQIVSEVQAITRAGQVQTLSAADCDFAYRHSAFADEARLITRVTLKLKRGDRIEVAGKMADLMERRRAKQPLELPSAGSTFKRPHNRFAGALIEEAGLKGFAIGGAQVSLKHAGFVVNTGDARCADVLALMRHIRETVERVSGIVLEPEIRLLGCTLSDGEGSDNAR